MPPRTHLACIVGARPNFMKMAPLLRALRPYSDVVCTLVHTGQHYDANLSEVFFEELRIPRPDVFLQVGSGSHAEQTARLLVELERTFLAGTPDAGPFTRIVTVGDVNSTMAAAVAAAKIGIPVSHVEAGLRSFDRSMPEEVNRLITDVISDQHFVSEPEGVENLLREGHKPETIHLVGNVMIDTLRALLPRAQHSDALQRWRLVPGEYGLVTLHRPSNVDDPGTLRELMNHLLAISEKIRVVFPVHPRTRAKLQQSEILETIGGGTSLTLVEPLGYLDLLALSSRAALIITDSGGLQEEATALNIPCLTLRANTERPVTVQQGTSTLVGRDFDLLDQLVDSILRGDYKPGACPELWDGKAAERIARILASEKSSRV
jgi:UDP-N-acetylglucosamine 2-epimerase (non-hydrolysing)